MKKYFIAVLIFFTAFASLLSPVLAQELAQQDKVTLEKNQTINQDYFTAGETVTILGTVNGDTYVAGGNILIEGTINGDLLVAGGAVQIRGTVNGNVRAVGGNMTISGNIAKNVTVMGGNISVSEGAVITGSLTIAGGNVEVFAPVGRGITAGAGNLYVGESVGGNITAGVGMLTLGSNAKVTGNLNYWSEEDMVSNDGATVSGIITRNEYQKYVADKEMFAKAVSGALFTIKLVEIIALLLLGSVLIKLAPNYTKKTVDIIQTNPWKSLFVGLITSIVLPVLIVLAFISLIGIPVAVMGIFIIMLLFVFAKIFASLFIGGVLLSMVNKSVNVYASLAVGLLVLFVLFFIPVIGWLAGCVLMLMGLGGMIVMKKNFYTLLRSKNLI